MELDDEIHPLDRGREIYKNMSVEEKKRVINEVIAHMEDFLLKGDLTLGGHSDQEGTIQLANSAINYHKSLLDELE
jgi:hypothetical protein